MEVIATEVPLATPLMLKLLAPEPAVLVIKTVGAVPPISKMNPLGAFSMIVPVVTFALAPSEYTGPVKLVYDPPVLSAEIALPPVAVVTVPTGPVLTLIEGLVLAVFEPSVASVAVIVDEPSVKSVTLKFFVPATKTVVDGNVALASVEVKLTLSVTVFTKFQFASTAFTVIVNAVPAT